jgi:IS5 family transposase
VRFRKALGEEEEVEALLQQTINVALTLKLIAEASLATVIVDFTSRHKAIAYPTDSKMLEAALAELVEAATGECIELKQTFAREDRRLNLSAGRYAHARQHNRMRRILKRQRTIVGCLQREIECKLSPLDQIAREALQGTLTKFKRGFDQTWGKKAAGKAKLYSWHTPQVHYFSKGKARTPFEFGAKVGIAVTAKGNLIVGARALSGTPFDNHTLYEHIEQGTMLMYDSGIKPTTAVVDLGYRGMEADHPSLAIRHGGKAESLRPEGIKLVKRHNAIEPVIGHLKADRRMDQYHLQGELGDRSHAGLYAAGYNIRWLLRAIARKGLKASSRLLSPAAVTTISAWVAVNRESLALMWPSDRVVLT